MTRGFKGRPLSVGPEARYDVVVIGAGIGGLIAANLLVREGLRVLLVERHYQVGGYCSTFIRRGFTFDAATHFYPLLGNPETLTGGLLARLGSVCEWVKMDPVDCFHFPDGTHFEVPADYNRYRATLAEAFPHEAEALERFFALVRRAYMYGLLYYFRGRASKQLDAMSHLTLDAVLNETFSDRKLKLLLCADCAHWGSAPDETSFVFDAMLRLSYFEGNYYPKGGSKTFSDGLAALFESRGGHILMKSEVVTIDSREGAVRGVCIETGPARDRRRVTVAAPKVVAAGDMRALLARVTPPEAVPPTWRTQIDTLKPSYPCFLMHLGLQGIDAETLEAAQGYYWDDWDPNTVGRGGLRLKVFVPSLYEPAVAPPGMHSVLLQQVQDLDPATVNDWPAHKAAVAGRLRAALAEILPGLDRHIVTCQAASAQTSDRFTANYRGAMLGWTMSPEQLGARRPGVLGPVKGLYFCGHWTRPGGGITPVMISAERVADHILGRGPGL